MPRLTSAQLRALVGVLAALIAALYAFLPDAQNSNPAPSKSAAAYASSLTGGELQENLRGLDPSRAGVVPVLPSARTRSATAGASTDHYRTTLRMHSPNFSTRTARIELGILHSTESPCTPGRTIDLQGVGSFLSRPSVQASIEVINNCDGKDLRLLPDEVKAWHVVAYNSPAVGIEQIGHAAQTTWPAAQLHNTAVWIARWHKDLGIPIQRAIVSNGHVIRPGILRHMDLGAAGGGHQDPGSNYPFAKVLAMARAITKPATPISAHTQQVCRKYVWFGPPGPTTASKHGAQSRARHGQRRRYLLRNHIACSTAGIATRK